MKIGQNVVCVSEGNLIEWTGETGIHYKIKAHKKLVGVRGVVTGLLSHGGVFCSFENGLCGGLAPDEFVLA